MAYKMKGSPMYRNFGVGGPMKKNGNGDPETGEKSTTKRVIDAHLRAGKQALEHGMGLGGKFIKKMAKRYTTGGVTTRESKKK
tara:strand:+ start:563 stop:811 length:249 start_codon:yes stop_codon:yes gene_type:complete